MTARFLPLLTARRWFFAIALIASLLSAAQAGAEGAPDQAPHGADESAGPIYRKEFQWGLYCDREPLDAAGKPLTTAVSEEAIFSDEGKEIAKLRLEVKATLFPPHATVLTEEEVTGAFRGIPAAKVVLSQDFAQTGHLSYTAVKQTGAQEKPVASDLRIPAKDEAATVTVNCTLPFFKKATATWRIGKVPPAAPAAPAITLTPEAADAKNQSTGSGGMAFLAAWSDHGWTWTGVYHPPATVLLQRDSLDAWTPAAGEAKTANAALLWSMKRCVRSRLVMQGANPDEFKPVNPANEGWSEWQPD